MCIMGIVIFLMVILIGVAAFIPRKKRERSLMKRERASMKRERASAKRKATKASVRSNAKKAMKVPKRSRGKDHAAIMMNGRFDICRSVASVLLLAKEKPTITGIKVLHYPPAPYNWREIILLLE